MKKLITIAIVFLLFSCKATQYLTPITNVDSRLSILDKATTTDIQLIEDLNSLKELSIDVNNQEKDILTEIKKSVRFTSNDKTFHYAKKDVIDAQYNILSQIVANQNTLTSNQQLLTSRLDESLIELEGLKVEIDSLKFQISELKTIEEPIDDPIVIYDKVKAFPGAFGAGANATGGRGGIVVRVTNLNATGAGSLRNALLMTVPRIIVFEVSGIIKLNSLLELGIANSNFTVAGQSAPLGGITISGKPIQMGNSSQACNNAIWRHIRFRNGSYTGQNDVYDHNGFISNGTNGLILDQCSFSFCDDQAISMDSYYGPLKNITIQSCLFSENSTQIILGLGGNYERGDMTILNNLFIDTNQRTPNMGGNLQWDIINNVFFNFGNRLANSNDDNPKINHIGNYYQAGNYSSTVRANVVQSPSRPLIYSAYNYHSIFYPEPQLNDVKLWTDFMVEGRALASSYFTATPFELLGEQPVIKTPFEAYTFVSTNSGANKYIDDNGYIKTYKDSFDAQKIDNMLRGISSNPSNKNYVQPNIPSNTRHQSFDTDNDGMCDAYELRIFSNLNQTANGDYNNNGYDNLEDYLNQE